MTSGRLVAVGWVLAVAIGGQAILRDAGAGEVAGNGDAAESRWSQRTDTAAPGARKMAGEAGKARAATGQAPDAGRSLEAARAEALPDPVPLLRLVNAAGVPLYTLSRSEADLAVARHGFKLQPNRLGYLRKAAFDGAKPIYRLTQVGAAGWLLTASAEERDSLTRSGRFKYEGVLGHAAAQPAEGTVLLSRYSGPEGWRVELPAPHGNPQALLAAGFKLDGPLGYVHPQWVRAGALYFGTWNSGANPAILKGGREFFKRDYDDPWAGVRDYSGLDPEVEQYKGEWPTADFSDRMPSIGFYDDAETATVEKHITQASTSGLDYFAFYWYWNQTSQQERAGAGLQSFLKAHNRDALDFALTICAHDWEDGRHKIPVAQYATVADRIAELYLKQPNYLRANDGRRILWLCDTKGLGSGSNTDIKRFVDTMRARARTVLGEEILVLAHQDLGHRLPAVGADGNYCAAGAGSLDSYAAYLRGQRAKFDRGAPTYVRCVMSGFDERPRYPITIPNAASIRFLPDRDFPKFTQAARNAYTDVATSTRTSVVDNFVLVYAWNEWHEGGYVEPNARDGCQYLDILRTELELQSGTGCVVRP